MFGIRCPCIGADHLFEVNKSGEELFLRQGVGGASPTETSQKKGKTNQYYFLCHIPFRALAGSRLCACVSVVNAGNRGTRPQHPEMTGPLKTSPSLHQNRTHDSWALFFTPTPTILQTEPSKYIWNRTKYARPKGTECQVLPCHDTPRMTARHPHKKRPFLFKGRAVFHSALCSGPRAYLLPKPSSERSITASSMVSMAASRPKVRARVLLT